MRGSAEGRSGASAWLSGLRRGGGGGGGGDGGGGCGCGGSARGGTGRDGTGRDAPVGAAGGVGDGGLRCAGKAALGAEVGVLLCGVGDAASLAATARQTRLVLNCVGPVSAVIRAVLPRRPPGAAPGRARAGVCPSAAAPRLRAAGLPAPRGRESCDGYRETCRWAAEFQEPSR